MESTKKRKPKEVKDRRMKFDEVGDVKNFKRSKRIKRLIIEFETSEKRIFFGLDMATNEYKYFIDLMLDLECGKDLRIIYNHGEIEIYRGEEYLEGKRELNKYEEQYWETACDFLEKNWLFLNL